MFILVNLEFGTAAACLSVAIAEIVICDLSKISILEGVGKKSLAFHCFL